MTFNIKGWGNVLAVLGNASGNAGGRNVAYTYVTNDTMAQVIAADYFLTQYKNLKAGDILLVVTDIDGTPDFDFIQVTASTSATVTTSRKTYAVVGDQTNVAALTEDSGAIGGTNDGDLPALTGSPAGTDAAIITALIAASRENATAINSILAALVAAGLMSAP